jgi:class 3 adenylate cyclase
MDDITVWLETIGLSRYAELFRANDITTSVLPELTDDDLRELGLSLGHRRALLRAIKDLARPRDEAVASESPAVPVSPAREPTPPRPEAERRQLTVMFADLVGSTALAARLDPEDMREVITGYQNVCSEVIRRYEGHVAKFMGDGVLAYFGWPRAHEDEAERAVRAGLALAATVGALKAPNGEALGARVGIATGLVVVGDLVGEGAAQEQAVVGETPNFAARLQGIAAPGQVVIAGATRRLLGAGFALADLGERELKGIGTPLQAYAVTGERPLESRFEAMSGPALLPMVGRDQELALLVERWALAKAGEGQGVLLVGEAGIGKSRISRALLDALAEERHFRVRYQCSPYHTDSAFWPVIQQLNHAAGLAADDPLEARLDKLEALLDRAGGHGAAPLIADLLGLDGSARYGPLDLTPQAQRARTLEALVQQMLGLAARQPVLTVVEDAHWIDPTTLEMIGQFLDRIENARVLILLTSRPDRQPALAAHPHVTRLTLNRLGRTGVEAIVARHGGERLPTETIDAIIARTDGVPLFVEELTKAVLETGETAIPASLHDSLMARLDRIPEVKEFAQIAACIGREFDYPLLASVVDRSEPDLRSALDKLAAAEPIFRRGAPPDARYTFKHALVRDAAYQSLLKAKRQRLHGAVASAILEHYPEIAESEPEILAHHYAHSGQALHALRYWLEAGRRALARSATAEAIAHLNKGLGLLGELRDDEARAWQELDLQVTLGSALIAAKGYAAPETGAAYARARNLCYQVGDTERLASILYGQTLFFLDRAQHDKALEVAESLLTTSRRENDQVGILIAQRLVGTSLYCLADFVGAGKNFEDLLDAYDPEAHRDLVSIYAIDPKVAAMGWQCCVLFILGHPDYSHQLLLESIEYADKISHYHTIAQAHHAACNLFAWLRLPDDVKKSARQSNLVK